MFTKRELDAMGWFVFEFAAFTNDFFVVSNVSNFWRCDFFFFVVVHLEAILKDTGDAYTDILP